jgi:hypothetical protein
MVVMYIQFSNVYLQIDDIMLEVSFTNSGVTKNSYVAIKQTSKHVICQVLKV